MDETNLNEGMSPADAGAYETFGGPVEQAEGATKRVVLAGIGAVATACDTAEDAFDRLVRRGQRVQNEWSQRADDIRRQNAGAGARARDYFRGAMDTFLNSLNVPNKGDVDTINVKLNILSRKLDDLQMDLVREPAASSAPREVVLPESAPHSPEGDLET